MCVRELSPLHAYDVYLYTQDDRRGTDRQINSLRIQLEDSEQLNKDLQDEITKLKAAATKTV